MPLVPFGKANARFAVGPKGVRDTSKLPVLHPEHAPRKMLPIVGWGGREGTKAPETMRRLQTKPDEPLTTLGNFARATRRQNKEFSTSIHPLSGRVVTLDRGDRHAVPLQGGVASRSRVAAERLASRAKNPEVADAARRLAEGKGESRIGGTPRKILAHSHPKHDKSLSRSMPSAQDTKMSHAFQNRYQNVVVSHRTDAARGQKNTKAVWHGPNPSAKVSPKDQKRTFIRQAVRDVTTLPDAALKETGANSLGRASIAMNRGIRRVLGRGDYDTQFRRAHGGTKATGKKPSAYYARETYLKRDGDGSHKKTGRTLQGVGLAGIATAAGANRISRGGGKVLRAVAADGEKELARYKQDRHAWYKATRGDRGNAKPLPNRPGGRRGANAENNTQVKQVAQSHQRLRRIANQLESRQTVERLTAGGLSVGLPLTYLGERVSTAKRDKRDVDREYAGAIAGGAAHQGAVYLSKPLDRRYAEKTRKDPKLQADWEAHRAKHGNPKVGDRANVEMFRDTPTHLPGARFKRTMARVGAGKTGLATAGVFAVAGSQAAKDRKKDDASKADSTAGSLAEGALGASLLGWSIPRHRFVGGMIDHGVYEAERRGGGQKARAAFRQGDKAMSVARGYSGEGAKVARKVPLVAGVVDSIPAKLRPSVATTIGAILLSNARDSGSSR